jgi:flagellar L-ring protein precursor FlgH
MTSRYQIQDGLFTLLLSTLVICLGSLPLQAQNSSLFQQPASMASNQMLDLDKASWTYVPPTPSRVLKKHDIISIRVDELARSLALGTASSRKNGVYDAVLQNWVTLNGLTDAQPTPQSLGDPRITGQTNQTLRANSDMETRELLTFNIAAEVIDIKPNGVVMLEARKSISLNDNTFETTLTGLCRSDDIGPDNVVLSRDLLDLNISKQDRGHVRDGYKRGWFTRWLAELNPF